MKEPLIHVGFAVNNLYAKYLAVTIASILSHLPQEREILFHIITADLSDENKRRLNELQRLHPFTVEYISARMEKALQIPGNRNRHVSAETNFRLEIASLKPELDKILFLDADLVANTDISPLWDTDLTGYCAACAPDAPNYTGNNEVFRKKAGLKDYYNTGVCLMNLAECRRSGYEARMQQALQAQADILRYPDQDLLNIGFADNILPLTHSWNVYVQALDEFYPADISSGLQNNAFIIHWAGPFKPWKNPSIRYADIFWKYCLQTPFFADVIFEQIARRSTLEVLQKYAAFPRIKTRYYFFKIASKITLGATRRRCRSRADILHEEVRSIRRLLKGGQSCS